MVTRFRCSNIRSSLADCISRCVGCELWPIAGAAEVQFLTTGNVEFEADTEPRPKDPTAAERQRRRRAKQRDGERDINRDSVTVTNGHALPLLEYKELAG